jgi:adenine-specific DNA-methyltransferase
VSDRRAQALRKDDIRPGADAWEREGICRAVTWPRCRAVIEGKRADGTLLDIDMSSGRFTRKNVPRNVRALSFSAPALVKTPAARKALAAVLGIRQDPLVKAGPWYIAPPKARDPVKDQAVLFDPAVAADFTAALLDTGAHIRTIHLVMPDDRHFKKLRREMLAALPPIAELSEEVVSMSAGLAANMDYLRLGFLDPDALEMGGRFNDLLPALWMMAGARGPVPAYKERDPFIIPPGSGFAALVKETAFRSFNARLKKTAAVEWVFIVTDSREAFLEMSGQLPAGIPTRNRIHLYRNYLENFQINGRGDAG